MTTLTVKNIPDELYRDLKFHALQHHRSLNSEVIVCIEKMLYSKRISHAVLLKSAREARQGITEVYLTDKVLSEMKGKGRP